MTTHSASYLEETARIAALIDPEKVEEMARELAALRDRGGRLFIIGLGGSAANASHAVNDFRRLCQIEAYTPVDNVAELTAAMNDDGPHTIFSRTLVTSQLCKKDAVLVLSVGGGSVNVSPAISAVVPAMAHLGIPLFGIVGRDGGETAKSASCCVIIPTVEPSRVTPHTEAFQSVVLHCLVSHPLLQRQPTKW